jgi:tRNA pseudouridine55 synthase
LESLNGAIVVDKPAGWTSHDVVNKLRRLTGTKKIGHLGTLDPLATGVLPLLVGKTTRLAQFYGKSDKRYEGVVRFGHSTDTYDAEGKPTSEPVSLVLDPEQLANLVAGLVGAFEQVPPIISAKKVGGVPAYKLARNNQAVDLKPVRIEIYSAELVRCEADEAELRIHCSAGTYMRTIAHDLGRALGCGAYLKTLRRTSSGSFTLPSARTVQELEKLAKDERILDAIIPASELLPDFPAEILDPTTVNFVRQGRDFRLSPFRAGGSDSRYAKAVSDRGELIAIGEARLPNLYHPVVVL